MEHQARKQVFSREYEEATREAQKVWDAIHTAPLDEMWKKEQESLKIALEKWRKERGFEEDSP